MRNIIWPQFIHFDREGTEVRARFGLLPIIGYVHVCRCFSDDVIEAGLGSGTKRLSLAALA